MNFVFPVAAVLVRIAAVLPKIVTDTVAEVKADKAATSDGGAKVTAHEVTILIGHIMEKLAHAVAPVVHKANGTTAPEDVS